MHYKYWTINECLRLIQENQRQGIELVRVEAAMIFVKIALLDDSVFNNRRMYSEVCETFFERLLDQVRRFHDTTDQEIIPDIENTLASLLAAIKPTHSGRQ